MTKYLVWDGLPLLPIRNVDGALGLRSIGISIMASGNFRCPDTMARYVFFTLRFENCFCSKDSVSLFLAHIITPDVARSRRCTMPLRSPSSPVFWRTNDATDGSFQYRPRL